MENKFLKISKNSIIYIHIYIYMYEIEEICLIRYYKVIILICY